MKYKNLRGIVVPLTGYLADVLWDEPLPLDVLVPVPLHHKRLRERGYNQSELLARNLAKLVGADVVADALSKVKDTLPQARTANVEERRTNVARAFSCKAGSVEGKRALLVDDVTTTGATLEACASELKRAGAASVWALTVAREL
ncbi:MAG: ComF family protein [Dehalococcoidia bacterium]